MKEKTPIEHQKFLFMDCDGVLIGNYGGNWQVRPYAKTFLDTMRSNGWRIIWISCNSGIRDIVSALYLPGEISFDLGEIKHLKNYPNLGKLHRIDTILGSKARNVENVTWFMIEDEPLNAEQTKYLKIRKSLHKWVTVPDNGADVLLDLHLAFKDWYAHCEYKAKEMSQHRLVVPNEWAVRKVYERDLCVMEKWEGYGQAERKDFRF